MAYVYQNTGALTTMIGSPFALHSSQVQINPAGTFLLSVNLGANQIDVVPIEHVRLAIFASGCSDLFSDAEILVDALVGHPSAAT